MRLEWLEDILAIAQTGSFSSAAERRNLSQSAFSRRIRQIEDHVGVELFDRSRKPVQLRPTVLAQGTQIEQISAALRQLIADLRRGDRVASNRIVIASQHSLTTSFAPRIVQAIQSRGEDIHVRLRSANLDECFGLLLSRQADLAILYATLDADEQVSGEFLESVDVGTDRLVPVLRTGLALPRLSDDLPGDIPYIAYPTEVFLGSVMVKQILPQLGPGRAAVPKAETALTNAALEMAAAGVAVAWVPESLARRDLESGRLSELGDALPSCPLSVRGVRLKGHPSRAEAVIWEFLALPGSLG
ncbi:LysR family transcriptional regulator [Tabrizicola sp.]|jgi:DNA-binding transcriptional LysR family regulator|uniref:LysR family transcriptional regulator n=1 Tax=Tabrizicola sp. TaxID=2005166 RepID=UPI0035B2C4D8